MIGKLGVIPDKILLLNTSENNQKARLMQNFLEADYNLSGEELERPVRNALQEYNLNIKGVREVFGPFIFDINVDKEKE